MNPTYTIKRSYQEGRPAAVIKTGQTYAQVQAHCSDPQTDSRTATTPEAIAHTAKYGPWFDYYTLENRPCNSYN